MSATRASRRRSQAQRQSEPVNELPAAPDQALGADTADSANSPLTPPPSDGPQLSPPAPAAPQLSSASITKLQIKLPVAPTAAVVDQIQSSTPKGNSKGKGKGRTTSKASARVSSTTRKATRSAVSATVAAEGPTHTSSSESESTALDLDATAQTPSATTSNRPTRAKSTRGTSRRSSSTVPLELGSAVDSRQSDPATKQPQPVVDAPSLAVEDAPHEPLHGQDLLPAPPDMCSPALAAATPAQTAIGAPSPRSMPPPIPASHAPAAVTSSQDEIMAECQVDMTPKIAATAAAPPSTQPIAKTTTSKHPAADAPSAIAPPPKRPRPSTTAPSTPGPGIVPKPSAAAAFLAQHKSKGGNSAAGSAVATAAAGSAAPSPSIARGTGKNERKAEGAVNASSALGDLLAKVSWLSIDYSNTEELILRLTFNLTAENPQEQGNATPVQSCVEGDVSRLKPTDGFVSSRLSPSDRKKQTPSLQAEPVVVDPAVWEQRRIEARERREMEEQTRSFDLMEQSLVMCEFEVSRAARQTALDQRAERSSLLDRNPFDKRFASATWKPSSCTRTSTTCLAFTHTAACSPYIHRTLTIAHRLCLPLAFGMSTCCLSSAMLPALVLIL